MGYTAFFSNSLQARRVWNRLYINFTIGWFGAVNLWFNGVSLTNCFPPNWTSAIFLDYAEHSANMSEIPLDSSLFSQLMEWNFMEIKSYFSLDSAKSVSVCDNHWIGKKSSGKGAFSYNDYVH